MASPPPSARPPVLSDEDAVEEPPPRREHKHTTANMQPERPWKRWANRLRFLSRKLVDLFSSFTDSVIFSVLIFTDITM